MLTAGLFIQQLLEPDGRFFYFAVVITVVVSIVVHELAHGFAALALGDDTPRALGHITLDPVKHMGYASLVLLLLAGIAWGTMPISPARLRGRYGHVLVALAGPASNLGLAALAVLGLGLWQRFTPAPDTDFIRNAHVFLLIFGITNVVLCLFNLLPIPPLDGSTILAGFHRGYADFISDPSKAGVMFLGFGLAFIVSGWFYDVAGAVVGHALLLVRGW